MSMKHKTVIVTEGIDAYAALMAVVDNSPNIIIESSGLLSNGDSFPKEGRTPPKTGKQIMPTTEAGISAECKRLLQVWRSRGVRTLTTKETQELSVQIGRSVASANWFMRQLVSSKVASQRREGDKMIYTLLRP